MHLNLHAISDSVSSGDEYMRMEKIVCDPVDVKSTVEIDTTFALAQSCKEIDRHIVELGATDGIHLDVDPTTR